MPRAVPRRFPPLPPTKRCKAPLLPPAAKRTLALAFSKRSRTRDAPTPTKSSTNSDAAHEKKGVPASPAPALASRVLPVPGGPTCAGRWGASGTVTIQPSGSAPRAACSRLPNQKPTTCWHPSRLLPLQKPLPSLLCRGPRPTKPLDAASSPGTRTPPTAPGPHQQAALGDLSAQGGVLVGVLQEVDHLHQLELGAVAALLGVALAGGC